MDVVLETVKHPSTSVVIPGMYAEKVYQVKWQFCKVIHIEVAANLLGKCCF